MHKSARLRTIFPGVDAVLIASDRTFPRHSHDEFGFGYIVAGGQDSWSGRGLVVAQAGDTITVNPGELHDGVGRKGEPRHWRMLYLSPTALTDFTDIPLDRAAFTRPVNRSPQALTRARDALAAVTRDQPERDQAEQLLMLALAAQLEPDEPSGAARPSRRSRMVQTVLEMINQAWDTPLSLADFAQATGASRFQILRRFSGEMGATPHAYLMQHRVKRAKEMILAGSSLADTAVACGFADQSHLTRVFSRQTGLTPGSFVRPATA